MDCYFTSLDYLIKALKTENEEVLDVKTRRSVRARLQTLSDALSTPEELANEQAQVLKNLSKELQGTVNGHVSRCSCVVTTVTDYIILLFNIIASSLLAIIVCIVDMVATSSSEEDSSHSKID